MSLSIDDLATLVYKVLSATPIEVFDEESNSFYATEAWELVSARSSGNFSGTRKIGSANMVTAYNIVYTKLISSKSDSDAMSLFYEVINKLVDNKLIRKNPELVRKTFKVI